MGYERVDCSINPQLSTLEIVGTGGLRAESKWMGVQAFHLYIMLPLELAEPRNPSASFHLSPLIFHPFIPHIPSQYA